MRKILLFLIVLLGANAAFAQGTYYWVGTTPTTEYNSLEGWNTAEAGNGVQRPAYHANDVLIVSSKEVQINLTTNNRSLLQLQIINGAKVIVYSTATGNLNFSFTGNETTKGLYIAGGSTFTMSANGGLNLTLSKGGDVDNSILNLGDKDNLKTLRLVTSVTGGLVFKNGSVCNYASNGGFGQHANPAPIVPTTGTTSNIGSVVFEAGTSLYHKAGTPGPFGNNQLYSTLNLHPDSYYYYQATLANTALFNSRKFGHLIIDEGASYTANNGHATNGEDIFTEASSLTLKEAAKLVLGTSVASSYSTAINGDVTVETGATLEMKNHVFNLDANTLTTNSGSTIAVANAGGVDAAIVSTGTRTFHANTIYSFNAAAQTNAPFPASIPKISGIAQVGGIIVNAGPVRLTDDVNIASGGKLQFGTGTNPRLQLLTKNLTLQPGAIIERANTNGRIEAIGTGQINALGVNGADYLLAVGNGLRDASVILETTSASDFSLNIANGVPEAISPVATGDNHVLATWNLNRTSGTGNFKAKFGWQDAWEQSNFLSLTNNNVSLYNYVSGAYAKITTEDARNGTGADNFVLATLNQGGIFIVAEGTNALPVTLSSFTAQKQGNSALIKWTTSSEQNNAYFEVQRSNDGHKFTTIGTRKGAGNSLSAINYSYTDFSPESGDNYYRLVQFDLNGNNTEYDPQVLNFHYQTSGFTVLTNQNTQQISFRAVSNNGGVAKVSLYTIAGAKVSSQSINISSGAHVYNLKTPHLTKGVYVIVYGLGNEVYREKLIK